MKRLGWWMVTVSFVVVMLLWYRAVEMPTECRMVVVSVCLVSGIIGFLVYVGAKILGK